MTEPNIPPVAPSITCWRDVVSALRSPGFRLPMAFALLATAEGYLLCLAVAIAVVLVVYALVVAPVLTALFGHVPAPTAVMLAVSVVLGGPLLLVNVRLMYRAANRWMRPRTNPTEGQSDA